MATLREAALIAVRQCMGARPGEKVLVVTDEPCRRVGEALWEAAKLASAEAMIVEMLPRSSNGEEPPKPIGEMMKACDVVLCPTSKSLSHTQARREACEHGARIATLPGITEDMMVRTLGANYELIRRRSEDLSRRLTAGALAHVTTPAGTNIVMSLVSRVGHPDTGFYLSPGDFGNLPAGEAYIAPVHGSANGVIVVDGTMAGVDLAGEPIRLTVEDGYVTEIEGGRAAERLRAAIDRFGRPARNIAELGIGTNDRAVLTGNTLEDEKVFGTVHIAIGDNSTFGGEVQVPSHLDGILLNPTLVIDGVQIIRGGSVLV